MIPRRSLIPLLNGRSSELPAVFSGRSWAQAENSPLRDWLRVARREVVEALGRPAPSSRAERRAAPRPQIAPRQYLSRSCGYLWKCMPILRGMAGSDDGLDERHAAQRGRDARYERRGAAGRASARSVGAHPRGEVTPMKAPSPPPTMPNLILLTAEDSSPEAGGEPPSVRPKRVRASQTTRHGAILAPRRLRQRQMEHRPWPESTG